MFHSDSLELALAISAAARTQPELADAVRRSTRRPNAPGWNAEFIRYPRWSSLLDEWPSDAPPINDPPCDWRLCIEHEALRDAAARQARQLRLLSSVDPCLAAADARDGATEELGAETAVWFGPVDASGVGVAPLTPPRLQTRIDFERNETPWYFRQSWEAELGEGVIAVVYSSVPIADLSDWAATLGKARALDRFRRPTPDLESFDAEVDARYWSAVAEFGAGAGHMINNPLGAIAGLAERLLNGETEPERRANLQKIQTQVDRVYRMIRDLHFLGRPVASSNSAASLADGVRNGVAKALARFADKPTARCAIAELPADAVVPLPPSELSRLAEELVVNALEAAGPQGFVEVRGCSTDAGVEIEIMDNGPGFTAADLANAFSPFYSGRSAGRGLGMGLPVCRRIAEHAGGRIIITPRRPTTVVVLLPTAETSTLRRAA